MTPFTNQKPSLNRTRALVRSLSFTMNVTTSINAKNNAFPSPTRTAVSCAQLLAASASRHAHPNAFPSAVDAPLPSLSAHVANASATNAPAYFRRHDASPRRFVAPDSSSPRSTSPTSAPSPRSRVRPRARHPRHAFAAHDPQHAPRHADIVARASTDRGRASRRRGDARRVATPGCFKTVRKIRV